ncbi:MAG: carboxypeptidase-like regulatory domain-containing protein, partial [Myxococcota bacterium]|nr:carboxypeptidase-like regulatory domain-containing protein [Myxococcota bacterium]
MRQRQQQGARIFLARRGWVTGQLIGFGLCSLLLACQELPDDNPFDPTAPAATQAPGEITGELLTGEVGGDLEGATVQLIGRSESAIVECLGDESEPCRRARFTLSEVPPGAYELRLIQPCFSPRPFATAQVRVGERTDLSAAGQARLIRFARGIVRGEVSGPRAEEMGLVRISDGRGAVSSPDLEGRFSIEVAACEGRLRADLAGYRPAESALLDVPVEAELRLEAPLVLDLAPIPGALTGTLSVLDGMLPEEGLLLRLESADAGLGRAPIEATILGEAITLEEVPTGRWRLSLSHPSYQRVLREIEIEAAPRGLTDAYDLGAITLSPAIGSIRGQVTLEAGGPRSPISVSLVDGPSAGLQQLTDPRGFFFFPLVRGGSYQLVANASGYLRGTLDEQLLVEDGTELNVEPIQLQINPGQLRGVIERPAGFEETALTISLAGQVTESRDAEPCEAEVDCLEGARCEGDVCLQPFGFFLLDQVPAGRYLLNVRPVDEARLHPISLEGVEVSAGETQTLAPIQLDRAYGSISGNVALPEISEAAQRSEAGLASVQLTLEEESGARRAILIDRESGAFNSDAVPVGVHRLTVSHRDHLTESQAFSVDEAGVHVELDLLSLTLNRATLSGTILDPAGAPVVGARILAGAELTESDAAGLFQIDGLPPGELVFSISAEGYVSPQLGQLSLNPGEVRSLGEVSLAYATGALSGVLTLETRENHAGAFIRARHLASGEETVTVSGADGEWQFPPLRVGTYQLSARLEDYQERVEEREILAGIEQRWEENLLYERGCLSGSLSLSDGAVDYAQVSIRLVELGELTVGDERGAFRFESLIPGFYTVEASREGYESARLPVNLAAGTSCDRPQVTLNLVDRHAPAAPRLALSGGLSYTPLAGASASPLILPVDWDERGRLPVTLALSLEGGVESPLADLNFDPEAGLGRWLIRINGGTPGAIEDDGQFYRYRVRADGEIRFIFSFPLFTFDPTLPLADSIPLQQILGDLEGLSDEEITLRLNETLEARSELERWQLLSEIPSPSFHLELFAEDSEGNRSESGQISLRLDHAAPLQGPLDLPADCTLSSRVGEVRSCETNRETTSIQSRSISTGIVCSYLIETDTSAALGGNLEALIDEARLGDCLTPGSASLISTDSEEGERLFCLFSVDASGRVAGSSSGEIEDLCLVLRQDTTAPLLASVYPDQAKLRGRHASLGLTRLNASSDESFSHYEIRNFSAGQRFQPVEIDEEGRFWAGDLIIGSENQIQLRAVDNAGNESEPVTVRIFEDSIRPLGEGVSQRASHLRTNGEETLWVSPTSCQLAGPDGDALSGRGCASDIYRKDQLSGIESVYPLPPLHAARRWRETHRFVPTGTPAPFPLSMESLGRLEVLSIEAQFSSLDPERIDLRLVTPAGERIPLVTEEERAAAFSVDGLNVTLSVDSRLTPRLEQAIEGRESFGVWHLE